MGTKRDKRKARKKVKSYVMDMEAWSAKTDAQLWDEQGFVAYKEAQGLFVLGVMGFAGSWKRSGKQGDVLERWVGAMREALREQFLSWKEEHGDRLVIASGATNLGVLQVTYALCEEMGIWAMGVAPDRVLRYALGKMQHMLPYGKQFGDESGVFLRVSDAFLLLGGGEQSQRETLLGYELGKSVTIVQGFGGVADTFSEEQMSEAVFVRKDI